MVSLKLIEYYTTILRRHSDYFAIARVNMNPNLEISIAVHATSLPFTGLPRLFAF